MRLLPKILIGTVVGLYFSSINVSGAPVAGSCDVNTNPLIFTVDLNTPFEDGLTKAYNEIHDEEIRQQEIAERKKAEELQAIKDRNKVIFVAKTVFAEAGTQSDLGKRLVVDVILNRKDSPIFPDDIYSVITQRNQFETYSNGAIGRAPATEHIIKLVEEEIQQRTNSTVLYFTAGYYNPYCKPMFKEGDHYFGR